MAATTTRSSRASNGSGPAGAGAKTKEAGEAVATAARQARVPLLAASAAAAGLAGGLALGSRMGSKRRGLGALIAPRRTMLGVPLGPKPPVVRAAKALGQGARQLSSATDKASRTADDVHQVRDQLEQANRQSPVEVLLDGLTHRRGAHKRER